MSKRIPSRNHAAGIAALISLAAGAIVHDVSAQVPIKVFLLHGQSNSIGWPPKIAELPAELQLPQKNIHFYYCKGADDATQSPWHFLQPGDIPVNCCYFGSEITFGHDLAAAMPNDSIAIAKGGTASPIDDWAPGTGNYAYYMGIVKKALPLLGTGYQPKVTGILWMQGESNSGDADYAAKLTAMIAGYRKDYNNPTMPFVIGMVDSVVQAWGDGVGVVRAQERIVYQTVPYVGITDTRGFPHYNDGHYNGRGQMQLGSSFAAVMARMLKNPVRGAFVEPSDLLARSLPNGQVKLTWRDNSDAETGHVIERKTGPGAYAQLASVGANTTVLATHTDATTAGNTIYTYRVKTINATGSTAYSNEAEIFPIGNGNGLKAEYFTNQTAATATLSRVDTVINFGWNGKAPATGLGNGFFVRWTGFVQPRYTENYTFFINSDMVGRIWVNNQQICNQWANDTNMDETVETPIHYGSIQLTAGQAYPIKVEYYAMDYSTAHAQLNWRTFVSQEWQVVPKSQLYPDAPPVTGMSHERQALLRNARGISLTGRGASVRITGLSQNGPVTVGVSDLQGRAVRTASAGVVDMRSSGNGAYMVTVKDSRGSMVTKAIIQK